MTFEESALFSGPYPAVWMKFPRFREDFRVCVDEIGRSAARCLSSFLS